MNQAIEIAALCAALDIASQEYLLSIGRRMLAKKEARLRASKSTVKSPPKLKLLTFGSEPAQEGVSDRVVSIQGGVVAQLVRKPVSGK